MHQSNTGRDLRGGRRLLVLCPLKLGGSVRLYRVDERQLLGVPQLSRERVDHGNGLYRLQLHVHGHLLKHRCRVDGLQPSSAASRLRHEDSVRGHQPIDDHCINNDHAIPVSLS